MLLRDVEAADLDAYIRMRCDPVLTTEPGGPQPRERIPEQLRRDLAKTAPLPNQPLAVGSACSRLGRRHRLSAYELRTALRVSAEQEHVGDETGNRAGRVAADPCRVGAVTPAT